MRSELQAELRVGVHVTRRNERKEGNRTHFRAPDSLNQGCQMAKFDPFLSEGPNTRSKNLAIAIWQPWPLLWLLTSSVLARSVVEHRDGEAVLARTPPHLAFVVILKRRKSN